MTKTCDYDQRMDIGYRHQALIDVVRTVMLMVETDSIDPIGGVQQTPPPRPIRTRQTHYRRATKTTDLDD